MPIYSTGDRVTQLQYGDGTVLIGNDHHTVVDFDAHGARTFATPLVRLESCSTVAPPKPAKAGRRTKKKDEN